MDIMTNDSEKYGGKVTIKGDLKQKKVENEYHTIQMKKYYLSCTWRRCF